MSVTSNLTLLQKAQLTLSDLTSGGGLLAPEQAKKFIRILIKRAVLLSMVTVETMKSHKKELNKIRFGSRVLRAGQPGVALGSTQRSKPDLGPKVELDAKLIKGEVRLQNEVLEDSIEQGQLKNTVMQELSKALSRDLEELLIQGDTASADPYLALFNGILKAATSNVVAAGGAISKTVFRNMLKAMPSEFLANKLDLRFMTSVDAEIDYRDSLSNRMTAEGDRALGSTGGPNAMVGYSGVPVVSVPLFPENLGVGSNETNVIFTDPKNIHLGLWRNITMETDKDITAGELIVVVTMRGDFKYEHEPAVVKATGVVVG